MDEQAEADTPWIDSLEGASTRFLTNTVRLGLNDAELAGLASGSLPVSCAPKVIHEAVHHWFFQTMLGESVALAKLAAYEHVKNGNVDAAADLTYRYTFLLNLYRPIFEAAALFGEFDALPIGRGHSPIPPHNVLPLLFSRATAPMPQLIHGAGSNVVPVVLAELRSSSFFVDEKCRLFATRGPYAVDYLLGYHDLKQWWLTFVLTEKGNCYLDGSLFLKLVHLYFFNDFKLASLLFDQSKSLEDSVAALEHYLARRLRSFPELAKNDELAIAISRLPPGNGITLEQWQRFGVFEPDAHSGIASAGEAMMLVFGNRRLDRHSMPALRIQHNRRPFHLASMPVNVVVSGISVRVDTISGTQLYYGELDAPAHAAEDGNFSSFILMDQCVLVNTVTVGGNVLFRWFCAPGDVSDEVRAEIAQLDLDRADLDAMADTLEHELRAVIPKNTTERQLRARCEATKRSLFGYAGCADGDRADARAWLNRLVEAGLEGQFPEKTWTRALALLGVAHSRMDIGANRPAQLLQSEGIDGAVLHGLEMISSDQHLGVERFGWRFFITAQEQWWPLL